MAAVWGIDGSDFTRQCAAATIGEFPSMNEFQLAQIALTRFREQYPCSIVRCISERDCQWVEPGSCLTPPVGSLVSIAYFDRCIFGVVCCSRSFCGLTATLVGSTQSRTNTDVYVLISHADCRGRNGFAVGPPEIDTNFHPPPPLPGDIRYQCSFYPTSTWKLQALNAWIKRSGGTSYIEQSCTQGDDCTRRVTCCKEHDSGRLSCSVASPYRDPNTPFVTCATDFPIPQEFVTNDFVGCVSFCKPAPAQVTDGMCECSLDAACRNVPYPPPPPEERPCRYENFSVVPKGEDFGIQSDRRVATREWDDTLPNCRFTDAAIGRGLDGDLVGMLCGTRRTPNAQQPNALAECGLATNPAGDFMFRCVYPQAVLV